MLLFAPYGRSAATRFHDQNGILSEENFSFLGFKHYCTPKRTFLKLLAKNF